MEDRDYRERLAHDTAVWQRDGIITAEQERAILARAGAGAPNLVAAFRMGWLITAVSLIGAIILGAGVVLMFAANWEAMPDLFRTLVMLTAMAAAYGVGYLLIYRYDMDRIGGALILLGVLLFEAGLFLLAQIYNMPVESPILLLLAAIGIVPVAYAFGSRIVLLLGIANFTAWAIWELADRYEDSGTFEASLVAIGALGVALYAIGRLHELRLATRKLGDVYVLAGALVTLALIYTFSFTAVWDELINSYVESYAAPVSVYISLIAAAVLVAAAWALRDRDIDANVETLFLGALLVLAGIVATWPAWVGYAVLFNAVFFIAAAGIVVRGYMRADERYINAGLALVAIGVLTRYCDVFWSMLAGSAFFIIGGLLLLGVAFGLDRLRRSLLATMDDDGGSGVLLRDPEPDGAPS